MANTNISFNDGLQRITINSDPDRVVSWYPNDINFVDRFLEFQKYAETITERIREIKGLEAVELDENGAPVGEHDEYEQGSFERLGEEFNAELDKMFDSPVSKAAFGNVNPISPTPNGGFVYENFLTAITPLIEESFEGFEASREKYTVGSRNRAERRAANKK